MAAIELIAAREILDSRGNPTVEVEIVLEGGARKVGTFEVGAFEVGAFEVGTSLVCAA